MASIKFSMCFLVAFVAVILPTTAQLTPDFYKKLCPAALPAIRKVVKKAISREPRMGASLLRLHFHDCFVNGCDGSILLDDIGNFIGEKTALPNVNSVRGFEVIDEIKAAVNKVCRGNVVSCADILAVAARDSVSLLGGPSYKVLLGRRDARTASLSDANNNLPPPFFSFSQLLSNFQAKGLNLRDLVALSGGHTLGLAHCTTFRNRIYNDSNIDPTFAASLQKSCPRSGGDNNTQPLDATSNRFDTAYFSSLMLGKGKGLLHSDQELFKRDGSDSDKLVKLYASSPRQFANDFSASMIKMGNLTSLNSSKGEIRLKCRRVN